MVSLVDAAICPRNAIVRLKLVLALADPIAVAKARLLPQLCPLHGCVELLMANSSTPAKAVSADEAVRDTTGVPPQDTCGVNPVAVPWWVN